MNFLQKRQKYFDALSILDQADGSGRLDFYNISLGYPNGVYEFENSQYEDKHRGTRIQVLDNEKILLEIKKRLGDEL